MSAPPRKPKRPLSEESKDANEQAAKYVAPESLLRKMVLIQGQMAKQSRDINLLIAQFAQMTTVVDPLMQQHQSIERMTQELTRQNVRTQEASSLRRLNTVWGADTPSAMSSMTDVYHKSLLWVDAWAEKNKDKDYSAHPAGDLSQEELKGLEFPDAVSPDYFTGNHREARRLAWEKFLSSTYGWTAEDQARQLAQFHADLAPHARQNYRLYSNTSSVLETLFVSLERPVARHPTATSRWEAVVTAACRSYGRTAYTALLWGVFHMEFNEPLHMRGGMSFKDIHAEIIDAVRVVSFGITTSRLPASLVADLEKK